MISEGTFRSPAIGPESPIQNAETIITVDAAERFNIKSPLWNEPYVIGDASLFKDPRADSFLKFFTYHQFHHLTTRQLSLVERHETRPGTSRYSRLGHMLDSAKLLQDMGASFEQIVQTVISDPAHPAGSHLRGDFMVGDYANQDTHDGDLWSYLNRTGFNDGLQQEGLLDSGGYLAGSPVLLEQLADPRNPRCNDIAECPRPDPNADRLQFTIHEGVLIHNPDEVREILDHVVRLETNDGERMALVNEDAARLLYILAVRHQSENWAEPLHRLQEELVLMPERYIFANDHTSAEFRSMQDYYPVDYTRTDEAQWYETIEELSYLDSFIPNVLKIAADVGRHQREHLMEFVDDDHAYKGPIAPEGIEITHLSKRRKKTLTIASGRNGQSELCVALPEPKYRGPINSWVVTKNGIKRVTDLDPQLLEYEQQRKTWVAPLLAKVSISNDIAKEIRAGLAIIEKSWSTAQKNRTDISPPQRPAMPAELLREQIDNARARVIDQARI